MFRMRFLVSLFCLEDNHEIEASKMKMKLIKLMIQTFNNFSRKGFKASALKEFGKNQENIGSIQKLLIIGQK